MQIGTNAKVCSNRVKNQVRVFTIFLKDNSIKENGTMVRYKILVHGNSLMDNIMKVIGLIIRKVGKVSINS